MIKEDITTASMVVTFTDGETSFIDSISDCTCIVMLKEINENKDDPDFDLENTMDRIKRMLDENKGGFVTLAQDNTISRIIRTSSIKEICVNLKDHLY